MLSFFSFLPFFLFSPFLPKNSFQNHSLTYKSTVSLSKQLGVPKKTIWWLRRAQSVQQGPVTLHATIYSAVLFLIWILSGHFTNYNYLTSSEQTRKFKTSLYLLFSFCFSSRIFLQKHYSIMQEMCFALTVLFTLQHTLVPQEPILKHLTRTP